MEIPHQTSSAGKGRKPQLDWCMHWEQEMPKEVHTIFMMLASRISWEVSKKVCLMKICLKTWNKTASNHAMVNTNWANIVPEEFVYY